MSQTAFVLISCMVGQEYAILEQVKLVPQVKSVLITYGEYDIVAKIEANSAQDMANLISSQIRQIQNIRSTVTLHVI